MNGCYHNSLASHRSGPFFLAVLAVIAGLFLLSGCSLSASQDRTEKADLHYEDASSLLEAVWKEDPKEQRPAVVGGIGSTAVEDKVAPIPLEEPEILAPSLAVPEQLVKASRSGACIRQALLANDFTAMIWQVDDNQDLEELAQKCQEQLKINPWLDTVPQVYAIAWQSDFIMICYGQKTWVDPFVKASQSVMKEPVMLKGNI